MYDRVKHRNAHYEAKPTDMRGGTKKHSSELTKEAIDWDGKLIHLLSNQLRLMLNWANGTNDCHPYKLSFLRHDRPSCENLPFSRRRLIGRNKYQMKIVAALLIQGLYRGFRARQQLKHALDSAKYRDADLDEMMNSMALGEADFNLDEYLAPPELDDGWLIDRGMDQQSSALSSSAEALVYGDHRRARRSNSAGKFESSSTRIEGKELDREGIYPSVAAGPLSGRKARLIKHGFVPGPQPWTNEGPLNEQFPIMGLLTPSAPLSPRPSSVMSDASSITNSSQGNFSIHEDEGPLPLYKDTLSGRLRAAANQKASDKSTLNMVAQEWGISDPRVLAMMMKRSSSASYTTAVQS